MDRFAQFFISPLMNRDAITREREAVESGKIPIFANMTIIFLDI
jgi:secreted Zn-dependent insulinase-like peptidase